MTIGTGDFMAGLMLALIGALAWRRWNNVGGKTWAFRIVPIGLILMRAVCHSSVTVLGGILLVFSAYVFAAYRGGWRLKHPKNRFLRGIWWGTHLVAYFILIFLLCAVSSSLVCTVIRFSPIATEGDWPWTKGRMIDELPFAVEYNRAPTFSAEYDKRILFKSGKRVGLLIDTGGYGPFRIYRLNDGNYCLVDGYGVAGNSRYLRVNVERETVELKVGCGWFVIPEKGYVRGWGGSDDLNLSFDMYPGGSLNAKGWYVDVKGTPVGDSLDGMKLIGEIDTSGKFKPTTAPDGHGGGNGHK